MATKSQVRKASADQMQQLLEKALLVDTSAPEAQAFISRWEGRYSERNVRLLYVQYPKATQMHTYRGWLNEGRQVRKGEAAIRLLAPHTEGDDEGDERIVRVRPICLFDVSQTDPVVTTDDP